MNGKKIAIIGAGNLGRSIALGLVDKGVTNAEEITLTKKNMASLSSLIEEGFQATASNQEAVEA